MLPTATWYEGENDPNTSDTPPPAVHRGGTGLAEQERLGDLYKGFAHSGLRRPPGRREGAMLTPLMVDTAAESGPALRLAREWKKKSR